MKKMFLGFAGLAAVAAPIALSAAPAQAYGTPGCATHIEYNSIHYGLTLAQVQNIVVADGRRSFSYLSPHYSHITQTFRVCGASRYSSMEVDLYRYQPGASFKVEDKTWMRI